MLNVELLSDVVELCGFSRTRLQAKVQQSLVQGNTEFEKAWMFNSISVCCQSMKLAGASWSLRKLRTVDWVAWQKEENRRRRQRGAQRRHERQCEDTCRKSRGCLLFFLFRFALCFLSVAFSVTDVRSLFPSKIAKGQ